MVTLDTICVDVKGVKMLTGNLSSINMFTDNILGKAKRHIVQWSGYPPTYTNIAVFVTAIQLPVVSLLTWCEPHPCMQFSEDQ